MGVCRTYLLMKHGHKLCIKLHPEDYEPIQKAIEQFESELVWEAALNEDNNEQTH